MRKSFTLFAALLFTSGILFAQDPHYSQFYASPLTLNPALTGINDCNYRVALMYRNQWHSITPATAFVTPSISFDINNLGAKFIKKGVGSAGLLVLNDKAGDGVLTNLSVMASAAYARPLDASKKMNASVGLQLGFVQKWFDLSKLTWEEQFDGADFNHGIITETGLSTKKSYFNMNLGGLYSYKPSDKLDFFIGAAAFNLISPKETFYSNGKNKLSPRGVIHAGARIGLSQKVSLLPMFLYMGQAKAREINIGTSLSYNIQPSDVTLYFGGYYRLSDAINLTVGGEYKRVRLGISYDINTSSLSNATNSKGGFEISLSYVGCLGGLILDKPILWCPRF